MRIILGAKPESTEGFMIVFDLIYQHAFLYIGLVVGSIIALLFILIDIFYLQNRLDNTARSTIIRLLTLIGIAMLVGITHYVLEKVVDII